jgi:hypothetical protein
MRRWSQAEPLTLAQLTADGCVRNINMPAPSRLYCRTCEAERTHHAYSHTGESDCYEICTVCQTYGGRNTLRGREVGAGELNAAFAALVRTGETK